MSECQPGDGMAMAARWCLLAAMLAVVSAAAVLLCQELTREPVAVPEEPKPKLQLTESVVENDQTAETTVMQATPSGIRQPVTRIVWRTPDSAWGASPLSVLKATASQMQREQKTDLGSDANAKALVWTLRAIAELEGRQTDTADGIPIIE